MHANTVTVSESASGSDDSAGIPPTSNAAPSPPPLVYSPLKPHRQGDPGILAPRVASDGSLRYLYPISRQCFGCEQDISILDRQVWKAGQGTDPILLRSTFIGELEKPSLQGMTADMKNEALVLHGANDLRLESREVPLPRPHEVQVSIRATGLCGSDLHYYNHGRNGNFVLQSPLVLGHEAAGIVTAVPSQSVMHGPTRSTSVPAATLPLRVSDRVALEVGLPCRSCQLCASGRYNLCSTLSFRSSAKTFPHADGTLQTRITHPADMCHKLPVNVSFEQGALVEPLAVSLHAINRSQNAGSGAGLPLTGSSALVLGAGAVGMLTAAALSVSGVTQIVIADIDAARLKIAAGLGHGRFNLTTHLLPRKPPAAVIEDALRGASEHAGEVCKASGSPDGFDRVFECTGIPSCVQLGIYAATAGGKLILVGMGTPVQTLPLGAAALREVDIIGVFRYANCYPAAIALFASGKLDGIAEGLVTHRVRLEDGDRAFRLAANAATAGEDEGRVAVKVVVTS